METDGYAPNAISPEKVRDALIDSFVLFLRDLDLDDLTDEDLAVALADDAMVTLREVYNEEEDDYVEAG